ncbi:anhydro-N-acetylmuramic acid kinase [Acuticoccus sp. M5D2P5]|uniref:anhydro-N-acetylmuramic acid kinase n=1 Tax=Acuticoccus kalidii TaxID=2910977 RepID=UPI001F1B5139|nr:anhydro-N-acetylmuramic acid kinase [Acuticoccus kalidii]MCF3932524.1 anhydro-N-acetylmuramic acid kinase [Acuticoccus kalidii]
MAISFAPTAPEGNKDFAGAANIPKIARAIGVISGTSMDAVDVALLTTDGEGVITRGASLLHPYRAEQRAAIRSAMSDAMAAPTGRHRTPALRAAEAVVTEAHGDAIARFLAETGAEADIIGWHGQTVAHAPERRFTMQIGDAGALADRFGLPVVADFRSDDVAEGGEGAPLVPVYHRALVREAGLAEPALVINLGGVANVTFIDGDTLIAFDTGPASALIDDAMAEIGESLDEGGGVAASGRVDEAALAVLLDHPYFAEPAPKSLDRDAFSAVPVAHLPFADRIATLTRFSAEALGAAVRLLPRRPKTVIAAGGGTYNATMMRFIADAIGEEVGSADAAGFSSDFMEAEAFAYLAMRSLRGLPLTFPGTTGIAAPLTGGRLWMPTTAV